MKPKTNIMKAEELRKEFEKETGRACYMGGNYMHTYVLWLESRLSQQPKQISEFWIIRGFVEAYNKWLVDNQYSDADLYAEWDEKGFTKFLNNYLNNHENK
jgi:hypothetical protein